LHAGDIELRQVDVKLASKDGLTKFDMALGFKTRIDLVEGEMIEPSDLQTRETD
jgi:flagella basal body P-ring formation protein FlgA